MRKLLPKDSEPVIANDQSREPKNNKKVGKKPEEMAEMPVGSNESENPNKF
jgi:hypothetical protein